jgi:hypothetical protein
VPVDEDSIIKACLLHDMGNIIKFRLDYFPQFNQPEGLEYWQNVQKDYFAKYGDDEHEATLKILKELNVSKNIFNIVSTVGYPYLEEVRDSEDFNKKVATYADFRVSPHAVVSIAERSADGKKRYEGVKNDVTPEERGHRDQYVLEIEKQIFTHSKIRPEDITDASIAANIEKLKNFEI